MTKREIHKNDRKSGKINGNNIKFPYNFVFIPVLFLFCGKLNYYVYKCIRWHKCDCNCAKAFTRKILADTFLGGFHKTLYFFLRPFFIAIELCFLFYLSID